MALIKVNERDLSWYYRQRVSGQLAVLVPGVATFGPYEPVYLTSNNFTQVLGTSSVDSRDISYNQAASFIKSGADVLFWRIPLKGASIASHVVSATKGEFTTSTVTVKAKYEGSFGNKLSYKCYRAGESNGSPNYRFLVYLDNQVVETLVVNFVDLDSEYYYDTVNQSSNYVEFDVKDSLSIKTEFKGKIDQSSTEFKVNDSSEIELPVKPAGEVKVSLSQSDLNFTYTVSDKKKSDKEIVSVLKITLDEQAQTTYNDLTATVTYESASSLRGVPVETSEAVKLAGGTNGTYNKQDVIDSLLLDSRCQEVFNSLIDPLQYSFSLIVDGGYNDYLGYRLKTLINKGSITSSEGQEQIKVELGVSLTSKLNYEIKIENAENVETANPEPVKSYDEITAFIITKKNSPAAWTAIESGSTLTVTVKGSKTSEFSKISQVDDQYVHIAESRGLAIYLVDGDVDWDANEFYNYTSLPKADGATNDESLASTDGFNTSYAAAYGPWTSAQLASTGVTRTLPGSYALITAWAQSIASGVPMYYAPAGVKRTQLPLVNSTVYQVDSAVNELWQNQDVTVTDGHKINPIINLRQYGYVIYGNSTLLKNRADGATSMLQSMSTRVLANLIKQRAFDISLSLQFDQIDSDLFSQFKVLLSNYMDTLRYKGALYDYLIIADYTSMTLDDLNNRTVPVTIKISPNPAAENFVINLEISQAGVSFADTEEQTSSAEG